MAVACTCQQCGTGFTVCPSVIKNGNGKYCSVACYGLSKSKNNRGENSPHWRGGQVACTCEQCGKIFAVRPSKIRNGSGKYCSRACYDLSSKRVTCTCEQCGKAFTVKPSGIKRGGGKYCSRACQGLAKSQNTRGENNPSWRGGHKYYRGPNWGQQRKLAYERDQGVCQNCGKKTPKGGIGFQVHHIKPYRLFRGDYLAANQLTNLITLCPSCHRRAEFGKIAVQPYLL